MELENGRKELTEQEIREIWLAGFYESEEGWNGEYPFGDWEGRSSKESALKMCKEDLEAKFQQYLSTRTPTHPL